MGDRRDRRRASNRRAHPIAGCRPGPASSDVHDPAGRDADENPYRVHTVVFHSGERCPVLVRRDTGLPVFYPNLFVLTQVRPKSFAFRTLESYQRSLLLLLVFAESRGFDLWGRIESGEFLSLPETDALDAATRKKLDDLRDVGRGATTARRRVPSVSRLWHTKGDAPSGGSLDTAANHLDHIHQFLKWATDRRAGELPDEQGARGRYIAAKDAFLERLKARIARPGPRRGIPRSLPEEVLKAVLAAVSPEHSVGIWPSHAARVRNFVLFQWLARTGLRIGEVLSVLVPDLDVGRDELWIERRPDLQIDPRRRSPCVKGDGRLGTLYGLGEITEHYLFEVRARIATARQHPYLFVDVRRGRPLSVSGVDKVFRQVATALGISERFSPHILRHCWNDEFSRLADRAGLAEAQEREIRNFLQGWKRGSETSQRYTERHVQEEARAVLREMGERLVRRMHAE